MYDIKKQYIQGTLRDPEDGSNIRKDGLGIAMFDESDKQYLANKEKQAEAIEYESFVSSLYNLDDPATAALVAEKILPDFFSKREAEIDKMAKLQAQLAKIRARGGYPMNNEEATLLFAIQKGYIKLPQGAIWDFKNWTATSDMQRGIFNPLRYMAGTKPWGTVDAAFSGLGGYTALPGLPVAGRLADNSGRW
jgi:hypothetical protein